MATQIIFDGTWKNEYGSILKLKIKENGFVHGQFCTKVGRKETESLWQDSWFNVTGFVNGPLISFVIDYSTTRAMGCHTGCLENDGNEFRIKTKGYFIADVPDDQKWRQTIATSSIFSKSTL